MTNRLIRYGCFAVLAAIIPTMLQAAEAPANQSNKPADNMAVGELNAPIVEASLFKNGMAYIKRSAKVYKSGLYELPTPPNPIHGTFWINSPASVDIISGMREVTYSDKLAELYLDENQRNQARYRQNHIVNVNPYKSLEGHTVGITFKNSDEKLGIVTGVVLPGTGQHLVLKTQKGYIYINRSDISTIETTEITKQPEQLFKVPFMQFNMHIAETPDNKPTPVEINYLTKGMTWAPAYRIDLTEPLALKIEQQATIRNEVEDMRNVRIRLITGYPNISMQNVDALISPYTNLQNYINQLNGNNNGVPYRSRGNMMAQQSVMTNVALYDERAVSPQLPTLNHVKAGELYFRDMGFINIKKDESFCKSLDKDTAPYENIVEWNIPANRDEWGRMQNRFNNGNSQQNPEQDDVWDGVRFKNPFTYPMTTAPVSFIKEGQFIGESHSTFVAPGEETTIHITKALSIRVKDNEYEDEDNQKYRNNEQNPNRFKRYGYWYEKRKAHGEMVIKNYRNTAVKVLIKKQLIGKLLESTPEGKAQLMADGISNTNARNLITWEIEVKPGEEITVKYSYEVIVRV